MTAEHMQLNGEQMQGVGQLLRQTREAQAITLEDAATQLRMPQHVVKALESEQWQRLGAPVFVRGQLRSYAKLLKVDIESLLVEQVAPVQTSVLVSRSHTSRLQRFAENLGRRAVYVVMTAALAVPAWLATQSHFGSNPLGKTASLDLMPEIAPETESPDQRKPTTTASATPIAASMAPLARPEAGLLKLSFNADSWLTATGADGVAVEKGLVKAGEQRSYKAGQVSRLVIGNAAAVEVQQAGSTLNVEPYVRGNVARLAVSSDGSVQPPAQ